MRVGARVIVETATHRLVYEVVRTQQTSFRSAASLRAQSAAVPGRPGREPTRAMITLSTCATFEDHAAGNFWSDEFHNPEHRIEKIGVLRSVRRSEPQSGITNSTEDENAGALVERRLRRLAHLVGDDDVRRALDVDDIDVEIAPDPDAPVGVGAEQLGGRLRTPAVRRPVAAR